MAKADLTAERLREFLHYDPETGVFIWMKRPGQHNNICIGTVAGNISCSGYIRIGIRGRVWQAHRLAWLYINGSWPKGVIDHINGNKADNRAANLRDVTHQSNLENLRSARRDNRIGLLGVSPHGSGFRAQIMLNGANHHIGTYPTPDLAHNAYIEAKRRLHVCSTI